MEKLIKLNAFFIFILLFNHYNFAQVTPGTLTFTYTPVSHGTSSYALVIWIGNQNGLGSERTLNLYCDAATKNRLPIWASFSNCGFNGGTTYDATSPSCRINGAVVGGPLTAYSTISTTWSGLQHFDTLLGDGNFSIIIEESWGASASNRALRYFPFVKSTAVDDQTTGIPNDANFTNISLLWQPNLSNKSFSAIDATIAPNPSDNGFFNIVSNNEINNCKVYNVLGNLVFESKKNILIGENNTLDLAGFANGMYIVNLSNGVASTNFKIVLNQ